MNGTSVEQLLDFFIDDLVPLGRELSPLLEDGWVARVNLKLMDRDARVDPCHIFVRPGETVLVGSQKFDQPGTDCWIQVCSNLDRTIGVLIIEGDVIKLLHGRQVPVAW